MYILFLVGVLLVILKILFSRNNFLTKSILAKNIRNKYLYQWKLDKFVAACQFLSIAILFVLLVPGVLTKIIAITIAFGIFLIVIYYIILLNTICIIKKIFELAFSSFVMFIITGIILYEIFQKLFM